MGSAECATEGTAEREGKDGDFPKLAPFGKTFVTMEDLEEADRIGLRLVAMGSNLIGYCLWRFWEDFEMWFPAIVADFDYKTAEHLLVYDMGTDVSAGSLGGLSATSGAAVPPRCAHVAI